jgi:hypothetical protein
MNKILQRVLLAIGVIALLVLVLEIVLSVEATQPGSTPAQVVHMNAGPYPLTVNLYKDPANAGFALPFSITTQQIKASGLSFVVSSIPARGVDATSIRAGLTTTTQGVQGAAEITVQGSWTLHIVVRGPAGQGSADVPILAEAPPAIPHWLGWFIGFIPLYGLLLFLLMQRGKKRAKMVMADSFSHKHQ